MTYQKPAELPAFPTPKSGHTEVRLTGPDTFEVVCTEISAIDKEMLMAFFCGMQGVAGVFRFDLRETTCSECSFDADKATAERTSNSNYYNVSFPIRIF